MSLCQALGVSHLPLPALLFHSSRAATGMDSGSAHCPLCFAWHVVSCPHPSWYSQQWKCPASVRESSEPCSISSGLGPAPPSVPCPTLTSPTPASAAVDCFKGVTACQHFSSLPPATESRDAINTANDMPADAHASTCPGILAPLSCARLMQPPNPLPTPALREIGSR